MNTITDTTAVSPRGIAITLIVGSMIIPGVGLLGWLSNVLFFASFGIKNIPMAPSTALCFLLLSISLLLMFRPSLAKFRVIFITGLSSIVALYGILTFVGLESGLPILPDNLFFPDLGTLDGIPMGRMASSTGILFAFSGISLLFILATYNKTQQSSLLKFWANLSGGIVVLVGLLFFAAYLINSPLFYGGQTIPMALTTSITFILVGASLLMINSKTNTFNQPIKMLKDAKIGTQLKTGFAILLLFVIVIGFISYRHSGNIQQQAEDLYNHPLQVRRSIGELTANVYAIRVDMKNIFLTSEKAEQEVNLHNLELLDAKAFNQIEVFRERYLGPESDVDALEYEFIKWKSMLAEIIRLHKSGEIQEGVSRTKSSGIVGQQAEVVLRSLEKISVFAKGKADELYANSRELQKALIKQLFTLITVIVLISLLISWFLLRAMRKPIDELIGATQRFAKGDLTARSSNTSNNELGELSNSFNALADDIQANLSLSEKIENISGIMLSEDDLKLFFQKTLHAISLHTNSQIAAVYLLSDDRKSYEHFESIGLDTNARQSFSAEHFEGEFGSAISSRKVQHIKNIPEDTRFTFQTVSGKFIPREILTIPVHANNGVIAIISLASEHGVIAIRNGDQGKYAGVLKIKVNDPEAQLKDISAQMKRVDFADSRLNAMAQGLEPGVTLEQHFAEDPKRLELIARLRSEKAENLSLMEKLNNTYYFDPVALDEKIEDTPEVAALVAEYMVDNTTVKAKEKKQVVHPG